ncbi:PP2C family protein-serine/threonine phosphatase [Runella aurantiaca]|uniref:Serine/threonine-protein phosphatase n=1 Tax=Runella aurantiaca TaxID=2282308 RepID=A0A369IBS3_9BACT|nr:protein phosphatase 2C domain-containing protein [Runella aurantiaca]RDB07098.1 serine/threonine-protein phosphatase [Runella aurantiaca]
MTKTIFLPQCLHELGNRDNNEDNIFPALGQASVQSRLFMVCDGVGGAAKGEVASQLTIDGFNRYFTQNPTAISDEMYLQNALDYVQDTFDEYISQHPDAKNMGCTLTLLHLHEAGATVAHAGDSRVYHLRNGRIRWQTEDHKMVSEMVKAGVLTPEQAIGHPQMNVISRAIQGKKTKIIKADVKQISNLEANDYFFLCTDGILENLADELLEDIIKNAESDEEKMELIRQLCQGRTQDNFSAYLIHIKEGTHYKTAVAEETEEDVIELELNDVTAEKAVPFVLSPPASFPKAYAFPKKQALPANNQTNSVALKTRIPIWIAALLVVLGGLIGWFTYKKFIAKEETHLPYFTPGQTLKK